MEKKHISLAGTATVGPKGQVVIPADVREKMGVKPGDKLIALYVEDKKAIGFITEQQAQTMIDRMGSQLDAIQETLTKEK